MIGAGSTNDDWRITLVISATADALLAVCALQTDGDPAAAYRRSQRALLLARERAVLAQRNAEQ